MSEPPQSSPASGLSRPFLTDAVIGVSASGEIVHWSTGAERVFGWTSAEAAGLRVTDIIAGEGLQPGTRRITGRRRDATRFPALAQCHASGELQLVLVRDLASDRHNALACCDDAGTVRSTNALFAQMFGFADASSLEGVAVSTLFDASLDEWRGAPEEQREVRARRRDGTEFWLMVTPTPLDDGGFLLSVVDIDDRKRTERDAQELVQSGTFELERGERARFSDALYTILGLAPHSRAITLRYLLMLVHADDRGRLRGALALALRERNALDVKFRITRADGEQRLIRMRARLTTNRGRLLRAIGKVMDVTDDERAAQERVELQRHLGESKRLTSLGRLAATMAHEFNNVLMGIETFVEVLRRRTADNAHAQNAVSRIQQSLSRGRRVTDEILRFMRDAPPVMTTIDVRGWINDFLPEAQALTNGRVEADIAEALFVRGDVGQLNQVLANLIINARDAAPSGPIRIEARTCRSSSNVLSEDCMRLTISDEGEGVAAEVRERMFEPLFTTKRSGTGLGLAVVYQIITAHGGTVEVESAVGHGTSFHIMMPLVEGAVPAARVCMPRRVLLVEDDPSVALGLAAVLEAEGIHVRAVAHGREALAEIAREPPELVVLDIGLPDISGAEVYAAISQRWPHLPVVFITAQHDDANVARYLGRPHVAFLRKPFEAEQLLKTLSRIAAGTRSDSGRILESERTRREP